MRFLARRALYSVFLLIAASMLCFILGAIVPGDFYEAMRLNPQVSSATVDAFRRQQGLSEPLPLRYFHWVESGMRGDWGVSLAYDSPAGPILRSRAANTLLLTGTATLIAWAVALPLGTFAAARPGSWLDGLAGSSITILLATPELVLALLLLLVAVHTGWFPVGGISSANFGSGSSSESILRQSEDLARHLFLPSLCLAAGLLPMLLSHVRVSVRETLRSPLVDAARGFGIPFRRILTRHVLPVAMNPIISLVGLSIGLLLSSSLVVEMLFSWPGLGQLVVEAILRRDFFLVIDAGLLATGALIAGNFLADLLLYASDPRIRTQ